MDHTEDLIAKLDARNGAARAVVLAALSGETSDPSSRLLRWIAANDINPWSVFIDPRLAAGFEAYPDMQGVLMSLQRCHEAREIAFVETEASSPRVVLMDDRDPGFEKAYISVLQNLNVGSEVMATHMPVGKLDDVDAYIAAFEERERQYAAAFEAFMAPDT
jgi:hypothetical protein